MRVGVPRERKPHEHRVAGRGVLLGGVSGVCAGEVVVLGAGVTGLDAAAIALGMQAEVLLLDENVARLREADRIHQGHVQQVSTTDGRLVSRPVAEAHELPSTPLQACLGTTPERTTA